MGVRPLRLIFLVPPSTPGKIMTLGEVNESTTSHFTLNSTSYLLILALAATAMIAVVVLFFAMRRRRKALLVEGQTSSSEDMARTGQVG